MDKLKKILSPTHGSGDHDGAQDSSNSKPTVEDGRKEENVSSAPEPTNTKVEPVPEDLSSRSDAADLTRTEDTAPIAKIGPTSTYRSYPLRTGENASTGSAPNYSGTSTSPMLSQGATDPRAMAGPLDGQKDSTRPLESSRDGVLPPRDSGVGSGPQQGYGSTMPLQAKSTYPDTALGTGQQDNPAPGGLRAETMSQSQRGYGGTMPPQADSTSSDTALATGQHGDPAPGRTGAETLSSEQVNATEADDNGGLITPAAHIPGSFPAETPVDSPSSGQYFGSAVGTQNASEPTGYENSQTISGSDASKTNPLASGNPDSRVPIAATSNTSSSIGRPMTEQRSAHDFPSNTPTTGSFGTPATEQRTARDGISTTPAAGAFGTPTTTERSMREPANTAGDVPHESAALPTSQETENREESRGKQYAAMGAAAGAGAGAGAIGAHAYSRQQPESGERKVSDADPYHQRPLEDQSSNYHRADYADQTGLSTQDPKAAKQEEKAIHKEEKKAEKEHDKAVKEHEKEVKKEEKKAEKEYFKAVQADEKQSEKEHLKSIKAAEKSGQQGERGFPSARHDEDASQESGEKEKKKGGLLGLFRRRRNSKGDEMDDEDEDASSHPHDDTHHGMKKLTKPPPAGYQSGDPATPAYAEYAVKENNHPGAQTIAGGYTAPSSTDDTKNYSGVAGDGKTMPAAEHMYSDQVSPDTQRYADAKMRGQNPESRYDEGPGGVTPAVAAYGTSGPSDLRESKTSTDYQGPVGGSSTTGDRNIVMHSDGTRRYEDGSPVDSLPQQGQQERQQQRYSGEPDRLNQGTKGPEEHDKLNQDTKDQENGQEQKQGHETTVVGKVLEKFLG